MNLKIRPTYLQSTMTFYSLLTVLHEIPPCMWAFSIAFIANVDPFGFFARVLHVFGKPKFHMLLTIFFLLLLCERL